MEIFRGIPLVFALLFCGQSLAETPQAAYGVSVVGNGVNCGIPVGLRCTNLSAHPYILLGGRYYAGDGGGGYFAAAGTTACTDNGGTVLKDSVGDCFYRMDDRAAIPVIWFGARCDAVTTVYGGTVAAGSDQFSSTSVAFQASDAGKVIEFDAAGAKPFRTTIAAVTGANTVTLGHAAHDSYPGQIAATKASFDPILAEALDAPGAGYRPQDMLTIQGGNHAIPAQVQVTDTGLVNFTQASGGLGYRLNDLITFTASDTTDYTTIRPATIQVTGIGSPAGQVTAYKWIDNGDYNPVSATNTANPAAFQIVGGHGSGFTILLLSNDGSFGVADVAPTPVQAGSYISLPPIPSATTDSGTGSGATVDLAFPTPAWTYGSDDTAELSALESWLETDYDRGIFNAAEVPGDHTCLLQTLQINRPVTWRSPGSRQAQLMQVLGSAGSTVDGTRSGFVLVAANLPDFDAYQDTTAGQQAVGFDNIAIVGGATGQSVYVDGNATPYTNDGLLFQNPTGKADSNVNAALENLQIANFPGNALSAWHFAGEFRGYNVYAGHSGGNCVDIEHTANPYRFYGLVASACTTGLYLDSTKSEEFHGASIFKTAIDVSVTGTEHDPEAYILFDGLQMGGSKEENMYLDQANETVICAANCFFKGAGQGGTGGDGDAALVIGPDAATTAGGATPVVLQLGQGIFVASDARTDILFDTDANGIPCNCRVALGGNMLSLSKKSNGGIPVTNNPALMQGPNAYAAPTFANAASVGVPLSLNPNELGIGVSSDTLTKPGAGGLKLRVECSTAQPGKARIVALAGTSKMETIVADGIGTCP